MADTSKPAWADANFLHIRKNTEKRVMGSGYYDPTEPKLRKDEPTAHVHDITWKHKDPQRAAESPDMVTNGDVIILSVAAEGIGNGPGMKFEILNGADHCAFLTRVWVEDQVKNDKVTAEWKVAYKESGYGLKSEPHLWICIGYDGFHGKSRADAIRIPVQTPVACEVVEIPDVLFNTESPIPCLDAQGVLIAALKTTINHSTANPGKELVIFGHTDTAGDPAYNFDLSKWRGESVKALLTGKPERFVDLADTQATILDQQTILSTLQCVYGWECDPGPLDGKDGSRTRAGRKSFQEEYNQRYQGNLKVDGIFGEKSWTAVFKVYQELLREALEGGTIPQFTFGYNGVGVYPCGESFPIEEAHKDSYASATNRRVELAFFEKGKCPRLIDHPDKAKPIEAKECPVYDPARVKRTVVKGAESGLHTVSILIDMAGQKSLPDDVFELQGQNGETLARGSLSGAQKEPDGSLRLQLRSPRPFPKTMQLLVYDSAKRDVGIDRCEVTIEQE